MPPEVVLVVDNGTGIVTEGILKQYPAGTVAHHPFGENRGPAGATAFGLRWLYERGFDWLYWVDDDDPPVEEAIVERLLRLAGRVPQESLGGVGVAGCTFDWRRGEMVRLADAGLDAGPAEVDIIAGNQQLLLRREVVEGAGVADPRLFFGHYEPEYCLRLRRAGFRLWVDRGIMQEYRCRWGREGLGGTASRSVIPVYSMDSMWQRYYRTRNYIYMMRNTFDRPRLALVETLKALARSPFAFSRGMRYGAKFARLELKGIVDGWTGRLGRRVEPRSKYKETNA